MRPKYKLTDLSIKQAVNKAKSSTKTIKISDGGGMHLQVHPNGSQYWRMNCRINGKQITLSFGLWPDVSLAEARRKQEEAKESIQMVSYNNHFKYQYSSQGNSHHLL